MIIIDNKIFFPFSFFSPENSPFLFRKLIVFLITSLNSKWFRADSPTPNEMIAIQKKKKKNKSYVFFHKKENQIKGCVFIKNKNVVLISIKNLFDLTSRKVSFCTSTKNLLGYIHIHSSRMRKYIYLKIVVGEIKLANSG